MLSGSPKPRKLAAASARIAQPIATDPYSAASGSTCGSTCTNMMRAVEQPVTRAASTQARSRSDSTWERITRAVLGHSSSATVTITTRVPGVVSAASTSMKGRNGRPSAMSATRVISLSTQPPR